MLAPPPEEPEEPEEIVEIVKRIRVEYIERPDLRLSFAQARRLWNLPADLCETALSTLVQSGFLARLPDGSFLRRAAGSDRFEAPV